MKRIEVCHVHSTYPVPRGSIGAGKKDRPVERITVAGNFFQLLKNIRAVGSDLLFPGSAVGSPSVDVGEIQVAGK